MKKKLLNILLILLPVMAVALATTVDSVTVFDAASGTATQYSYFSIIPNESMQMLPPAAATLCVIAAILAVIVVAFKKAGCLAWVKWISMGAAVVAVIPVIQRGGDTLMVPNAVLPLLMLVESFLASAMLKSRQTPDTQGEKLKLGPEKALKRNKR